MATRPTPAADTETVKSQKAAAARIFLAAAAIFASASSPAVATAVLTSRVGSSDGHACCSSCELFEETHRAVWSERASAGRSLRSLQPPLSPRRFVSFLCSLKLRTCTRRAYSSVREQWCCRFVRIVVFAAAIEKIRTRLSSRRSARLSLFERSRHTQHTPSKQQVRAQQTAGRRQTLHSTHATRSIALDRSPSHALCPAASALPQPLSNLLQA